MIFLRVCFVFLCVYSIYVMVTETFTNALAVFLLGGMLIWVGTVMVDAGNDLRNTLTRPSVNVYVEQQQQERHSDPTRPDEHPLIVLNRQDYRRRK